MGKPINAKLSAADWQPVASGQARLELTALPVGKGSALCMQFDFKGGKGFVVARQSCRREMPVEYAVRFRLRGRGAPNDLEIKLVDGDGQNVWRRVYKDFKLPLRWRAFSISSHEMEFAWGPAGGERLPQLGSVEIALVAGAGGAGAVWVADLQIEDRTPAQPRARASSSQRGAAAAQALHGAGWRPRAQDAAPWIIIDAVRSRLLGGMIIDWLQAAPASGFRILHSGNGRRWDLAYRATRAAGRRSYVHLPALQTRFLRLELDEPCAGARLALQAFDFSRSIEAFWHGIAQREPRGWLPRWLCREQSLWTPSGIANGRQCALINEDGLVEPAPGSFTLEPMLFVAGRLFTWAEVAPRQELREGWMPLPCVIWETGDWQLRIECETLADGVPLARYSLRNTGRKDLAARLFVLIRPFQVTPPWQHFRDVGGVRRIRELRFQGNAVLVDEAARLLVSVEPDGFGAAVFDEGPIAAALAGGLLPVNASVRDEFGFASAALAFDWLLAAGHSQQVELRYAQRQTPTKTGTTAVDWRALIPDTQWSAHGWADQAIRTALTATAQVLITRDGPALQPGPRRYTRSWIRDGAMMSAALLRMGCTQAVRDYIEWYAPFQREDGFVPCCVDREGVDWLVEHDSHGQLIALIADYHAFSGDDALLAAQWPRIDKAVACIQGLLDDTGLLPISASHEGYLAQPVHSYWDDFWALRGLGDAVQLARRLGHERQALAWESTRKLLAAALWKSIATTCAAHRLDFVPGSVEWADFDPTATANAIVLLDVPEGLDRGLVERTFDTYMTEWRRKRSGEVPASNYTAYEIRIIGALVRLNRRAAALELLRFFLAERRPLAWNQWPEITWKDARSPAHVGDVPHTWIAAEYVLALRSLFAYEREADGTLVIGAGLDAQWLEGEGVRVQAMPTLYGPLSYSLRCLDAHTLSWRMERGVRASLELRPPLSGAIQSVQIDGREHSGFSATAVWIAQAPAEMIIRTAHA